MGDILETSAEEELSQASIESYQKSLDILSGTSLMNNSSNGNSGNDDDLSTVESIHQINRAVASFKEYFLELSISM